MGQNRGDHSSGYGKDNVRWGSGSAKRGVTIHFDEDHGVGYKAANEVVVELWEFPVDHLGGSLLEVEEVPTAA